jgi:hypothetical protein
MASARRRTQRTNRTSTRSSVAASPMAAALESEEIRNTRIVNWQSELKYINQDLRDLLIISTILFVLLFAVGFML